MAILGRHLLISIKASMGVCALLTPVHLRQYKDFFSAINNWFPSGYPKLGSEQGSRVRSPILLILPAHILHHWGTSKRDVKKIPCHQCQELLVAPDLRSCLRDLATNKMLELRRIRTWSVPSISKSGIILFQNYSTYYFIDQLLSLINFIFCWLWYMQLPPGG